MCVYGFTDADSIKDPKNNRMLMVEPTRTDFQIKQEKDVTVCRLFFQTFNGRSGSCTVDMWSARNFFSNNSKESWRYRQYPAAFKWKQRTVSSVSQSKCNSLTLTSWEKKKKTPTGSRLEARMFYKLSQDQNKLERPPL